jgi:hypothetical protein
VETAGKGNLQTETYNQDYNYKDRLESGKQVVGPILNCRTVEEK